MTKRYTQAQVNWLLMRAYRRGWDDCHEDEVIGSDLLSSRSSHGERVK
jgi:hypothetical protein